MRIQNKRHGIYRVNGGKEYKASRLGGIERVRGGEKVVIRARKRKEEEPICLSRLSRSCFKLSRAYESCFAPEGGHLGIFWVGMCRPGLQIGTPF